MIEHSNLSVVSDVTDTVDNLIDILDDAPLLPGEKMEDYEALRAAVIREVNPSSLVDQVLVCELTACLWEERRYRRCRDTHLNSKVPSILEEKLKYAVPFDDKVTKEVKALGLQSFQYANYLASHWGPGYTDVRNSAIRILTSAGMSYDDVISRAVSSSIDTLRGFDALISNAVKSRNRVIEQIERRKEKRQRLVEKMDAIVVEE